MLHSGVLNKIKSQNYESVQSQTTVFDSDPFPFNAASLVVKLNVACATGRSEIGPVTALALYLQSGNKGALWIRDDNLLCMHWNSELILFFVSSSPSAFPGPCSQVVRSGCKIRRISEGLLRVPTT